MRILSLAMTFVVGAILGCDPGTPNQGVRLPCAAASGTLLGCEHPVVESPEDACWRLVECGVIPLDHEQDNFLDWSTCVSLIEQLPDYRYDFALRCIETSSCDDLKVDGSPTEPRRNATSLPLCLEYGDQNT